MKHASLFYWLGLYWMLLSVYAIFSYALTDPNLVLSQWGPYWQFQLWMWENLFHNAGLTTGLYAGLMLLLFAVFAQILSKLDSVTARTRVVILAYVLMISPLLFSYNALSHDVFNYIFNARMVVEYGLDPHQQVALEFDDTWTRFMHNTHTAAPYGYGWTGLSLVPYMLGFGYFSLTWMGFRMFSLLGLLLAGWVLQKLSRSMTGRERTLREMAFFFLNPLVLIELLSNTHNDIWMLIPALAAFTLVWKLSVERSRRWLYVLSALIMFVFSISIKFTTLVWIPVLMLVFVQQVLVSQLLLRGLDRIPLLWVRNRAEWIARRVLSWINQRFVWLPSVSAVLAFLPLFTDRSQQFHPWYLVWSLIWIPFLTKSWIGRVLIVFSVSSMLRYLPWLYYGNYTSDVLALQRITTWVIPALYLCWLISRNLQSFRSSRVWLWIVGQENRVLS